jgi:hypothetical protein
MRIINDVHKERQTTYLHTSSGVISHGPQFHMRIFGGGCLKLPASVNRFYEVSKRDRLGK